MRTNKRFLGVMLDDATLTALKARALQDGRSLSGLARLILSRGVQAPDIFLSSGVNASFSRVKKVKVA